MLTVGSNEDRASNELLLVAEPTFALCRFELRDRALASLRASRRGSCQINRLLDLREISSLLSCHAKVCKRRRAILLLTAVLW